MNLMAIRKGLAEISSVASSVSKITGGVKFSCR